MPIAPKEIVSEIESSIAGFQRGLPEIEKRAYRELQSIVRELDLLPNGNIRVSVNNLRKIAKAKSRVQSIILGKDYNSKVRDLSGVFDNITTLQTDYFADAFTDFSPKAVVSELKKVAIESTKESLSAASIENNIVKKVGNILETNIRAGNSFADMNTALKDFILGNDNVAAGLESYSKQALTDGISQYSANYQKIITDDLGLEWYRYVGPEVAATRPICHALVDKEWIHVSELGGIARGIVDGEKVSTAGMIAGTNAGNFQVYRGGYNCNHLLMPVPEEAVPKDIRISMYRKLGVEYDNNGYRVAA